MSKKAAVGIDLGTTNSCVAVVQYGKVEIIENDMKKKMTPSYISFTETKYLIGNEAKEQYASYPTSTIFYFKRMMGIEYNHEAIRKNVWPFETIEERKRIKIKAQYKSKDQLFAPEEVCSMLISYLKETAQAHLKQEVQNVVISVPGFFNNLQRQATIDAGYIAGLKVILIDEPSAAAFAYRYHKKISDTKTVLFFDFGFGKLEVSIVQYLNSGKVFQVIATAYNENLGGADLDREMVTYLMKKFTKECKKDMSENPNSRRRLLAAWEQAKNDLSSNDKARISIDALFKNVDINYEISREKFEKVCGQLLNDTIEPVKIALKSAKMETTQIDEVVLLGGSSRIHVVKEKLKHFFSQRKLDISLNSGEAIATGAALYAFQILERKGAIYPTENIPYSLIVSTNTKEEECLIIDNVCKEIKWRHIFQKKDELSLFLGEPEDPRKVPLVTFIYNGNPTSSTGTNSLVCSINSDGTFYFYLQDLISHQCTELAKMESVLLSRKELKRLRAEAQLLKNDNKEQREKEMDIYKFETFLSEMSSIYMTLLEGKKWLEENCHLSAQEIKFKHEELKKMHYFKTSKLMN